MEQGRGTGFNENNGGESKARNRKRDVKGGVRKAGVSILKFNSFVASLTKLTSYNTGL